MSDSQTPMLKLLVYSQDSDVREQVIQAVGTRLDADLPPVVWDQAATATIAQDLVHNNPYAAIVLDGETSKISGTVLSRTLLAEEDIVPPIVMLVARPQDEWLANWAGSAQVVQRPINPIDLQEKLLAAVKNA